MNICINPEITNCVHSTNDVKAPTPIKNKYLPDYALIRFMIKKFNKLFIEKGLPITAVYSWTVFREAAICRGQYRSWIMSFIHTISGNNIANFRLDRAYSDSRYNSIIIDSTSGKIICEGIGIMEKLRLHGVDFINDKLFTEEEIITHVYGVQPLQDICIRMIRNTVSRDDYDKLELPRSLLKEIKK
ncbi:hypothetical protein 15D039_00148 [Fowlpox virus]|nr:hypothetical protein 10D392_00148 [Fowlpox virus]URH25127.1 hypothetical protein 13D121_00151 [Fowlpox virus]URH25391.1 hypothetical protein 14D047_00150 [Fowlpox virus]URH25651.1 hypothetical protein 15D039_00148 [Fowlpox virus]URH25910.1 hypothetical protein 18Q061_00150 [Fowlpox virus]